jgi:hypothetical protein
MLTKNNFIPQEYITKKEVESIVENSADEVMRSCAVQFAVIDERFNKIEETMATKNDINDLYKIMVNRFDAVDAKFDRMHDDFNKKLKESNDRFHAFELYMQGHEKRIRRVEKHIAFA